MIKIVKNPGTIHELKNERYLLSARFKGEEKDRYSKIRFDPFIYYLTKKFKK